MSKYKLAAYPQDKYRFELYDNTRKLTWQQIKRERKCYALINLQYFALTGKRIYEYEAATMVAGKWLCKPIWHEFGICIDRDGKLTRGTEREAVWDYAIGGPPLVIDRKTCNPANHAKNGYTMVGIKADSTPVFALCTRDEMETTAVGVSELMSVGCTDIFLYDGSWSTQGSLGPGLDVDPSQERIVRSYLLVFERDKKEEDMPMGQKYKVCIDAGHGVETAGKCAPDKSYYEHEFNLDISKRQKTILERHGIEVSMTRNDKHDISLEKRVKIANGIGGLDLFISNHSNASGDGWTSPDGYGIYTSAAGATAKRNIASGKLIARAKEAGVKLWGNGLFHEAWYVCKYAVAPAILIEHGFHSNRAEVALLKTDTYRQKLAEVDCKGTLDYLGITWQDEPVKEPVSPEKPVNKPWYADDQTWAKDNGVSDGTRPEANITRAEVWAMLHKVADMK